MNYILNRSNRKTIGIYIINGGVEVRAPYSCPKSEIDQFVALKEEWIRSKLNEAQRQTEKKNAFSLNYGDKIYLCGDLYAITAREGNRAGIDEKCFYMPPNLEPSQIQDICVKLYRNFATVELAARVEEFARIMGVSPSAVKINGAKSRWGSCSSKKSINFSWRLVMADDETIDYVVVHELAHLKHMNHSKQFWDVVADVLPDYKMRKARLLKLQKKLNEENWG